MPHGESLQSFCLKYKVPYNIFQKWFKDTRKKIVEVKVDEIPVGGGGSETKPNVSQTEDKPVCFWVDIRISINNNLYLQDVDLPIDNNLAERTIRKLTTQRNNSYHYGSDAGAEMAATYHSVISTVKLHGSSAWDFIGGFFKKIFNGCRDYANRIPARIALATNPCDF